MLGNYANVNREKIATLKAQLVRLKEIETTLASAPDGQVSLTDCRRSPAPELPLRHGAPLSPSQPRETRGGGRAGGAALPRGRRLPEAARHPGRAVARPLVCDRIHAGSPRARKLLQTLE